MNIVFLDGYTLNPGDISWVPLEGVGTLTVYDRTLPEQILDRAADADVVLVNKLMLTQATLACLPKLKLIGVTATGYNNVDTIAARALGVAVSNVRNYGATSVAQQTFALLLALVNRVETHSELVRQGAWTKAPDWCFWNTPLLELSGRTLGLVGYGDIGSAVAKIGLAMGMAVKVYRRSHSSDVEAGIEYVSLDELYKQSDVISLHCPLTPETAEMINEQSLGKMRSNCFLINTGRGGLIHEHNLAAALESGRIAGAGLDVLSAEPPQSDNPLLHARNCVITPHIAWATVEARRRLLQMTADNISAFTTGNPVNIVN